MKLQSGWKHFFVLSKKKNSIKEKLYLSQKNYSVCYTICKNRRALIPVYSQVNAIGKTQQKRDHAEVKTQMDPNFSKLMKSLH